VRGSSNTYVAAEVGGAVRAVADNPEDCGGALLFALELAALLSWHSWREEGWEEVVVVGWLVEEDLWEEEDRDQVLYLSETEAYASSARATSYPHVTRDATHFVIPLSIQSPLLRLMSHFGSWPTHILTPTVSNHLSGTVNLTHSSPRPRGVGLIVSSAFLRLSLAWRRDAAYWVRAAMSLGEEASSRQHAVIRDVPE